MCSYPKYIVRYPQFDIKRTHQIRSKKKKIQYSILEPCLNRYKSNIVILNECVCVCV